MRARFCHVTGRLLRYRQPGSDMITMPRLADEHAIRNVLLRYCRGIDRIDLDLVRECFHPDARDNHGGFDGTIDEFIAWIARLLPRYGVSIHNLTNMLIEFHPTRDDVAHVETYGTAEHQTIGGGPHLNLSIFFRYIDRFERRDQGGWRIADRVGTTELVRVNDPTLAFPTDERYPRGRRGDRSDPVYRPFD